MKAIWIKFINILSQVTAETIILWGYCNIFSPFWSNIKYSLWKNETYQIFVCWNSICTPSPYDTLYFGTMMPTCNYRLYWYQMFDCIVFVIFCELKQYLDIINTFTKWIYIDNIANYNLEQVIVICIWFWFAIGIHHPTYELRISQYILLLSIQIKKNIFILFHFTQKYLKMIRMIPCHNNWCWFHN